MIKKLVCLLLCVVCLWGVAFADACFDHFMQSDGPTNEVAFRYYSLDEHQKFRRYMAICYQCGETGDTWVLELTEAHTWTYSDGGHIAGKLKHSRLKTCTLCDKTINEWLDCPGNGFCIVIMRSGRLVTE